MPDTLTQPACAGAPKAKQKPVAINASADPRQYDLIGTSPSRCARVIPATRALAVPLLTQKDDWPALQSDYEQSHLVPGAAGPMPGDFDNELPVPKGKLGPSFPADRASHLSCGSGIHAGSETSARP